MMKDAASMNLMQRLKKMMPAHVSPKFTNAEEWRIWQEEEGRKRSEAISRGKSGDENAARF
jgi:DNA replication protein DnaC